MSMNINAPVPIEIDGYAPTFGSNIPHPAQKWARDCFNAGVNPVHISSHHGAHLNKEIFPITCSIAREHNIRVIQLSERFHSNQREYAEFKVILEQHKLLNVPYFIRGWYWGNIDEPFETAVIITHPGYGELWREYDLSTCCNPQLKNYLTEKNIQLINFSGFITECTNGK